MRVLHAGCGGQNLPPWFPFKGEEVRLDADENVEPKPDIVATIQQLGDIGPFDAIYCCHTLEHVHWYDAMQALREFYRVLAPGGTALIQVPDLTDIKPDDQVHYVTGDGLKITGIDMHFGYREYSHGNPWMIHRCGFMEVTLGRAMEHAGFGVKIQRQGFDLLGIGVKP